MTSDESTFTVTISNSAPYMSPAPANIQFSAGSTKVLDFSTNLKDNENNEIFVTYEEIINSVATLTPTMFAVVS